MAGQKVELRRPLSDEEIKFISGLLSGHPTERQQLIAEIILLSQLRHTTKDTTTSLLEKFKIIENCQNRKNLESLVRKVIGDLNAHKTASDIITSRGKGELLKKSKSPVIISRSLSSTELEHLESLLALNDQSKRSVLLAQIIKNALNGIDNYESARQISKSFSFSNAKDPVGTTRALITRVINDINSDLTVSEILAARGRGELELQKWNDEKIISKLIEYHNRFSDQFSYNRLKQEDAALISIIENRGSFQNWLIKAGINPLVHLQDVDWGDDQNAKLILKGLLEDIKRRCGIENLNVSTMDTYQNSILGISDLAHIDFDECRKFGCIRRVSGAAIVRKIVQVFGSYKVGVQSLLNLSNEEYESLIERKKHSVELNEYLDDLSKFIELNPDWLISDFASQHNVSHHGLHNKREKFTFFDDCFHDVMASAVAEIKYQESSLSKKQFSELIVPQILSDVISRRTTNLETRLEGYRFQKLFLKMLTCEEVGLINGKDFIYENEIDRQECTKLGHRKICKPDFVFPGFIIDTKRSVTAGKRVANQTERYLEHTDHLIHVTINQSYKIKMFGNKMLTRLTIFEFIEKADEFIGREIPESWNEIFNDYAKEASKRISSVT